MSLLARRIALGLAVVTVVLSRSDHYWFVGRSHTGEYCFSEELGAVHWVVVELAGRIFHGRILVV